VCDNEDVYLYYSISGEFGIAVAKLKKQTMEKEN
tara:strand:- start:101 stop:202 length:102 start_codon:yes stop_codon:yes gene_type:complete